MQIKEIILAIVIATLVPLAPTIANEEGQMSCKVTDPTGTPLNVRKQPNGKVINTLRNGREVYILEITYDNQRRPWAKVAGFYNGEYRVWGWVLREFISCYTPPN